MLFKKNGQFLAIFDCWSSCLKGSTLTPLFWLCPVLPGTYSKLPFFKKIEPKIRDFFHVHFKLDVKGSKMHGKRNCCHQNEAHTI